MWGQDAGFSTAALSKFPNCVAFSGHSHTPLRDERTVWQGAFTSVGTASLRYLIPFGGRENASIFGVPDNGPKQMPPLRCQDGQNALFMSVYDDRIVLERRDALNDLPLGPDWIIPLLADGVDRTALPFAPRAKTEAVPQFTPGATVSATHGTGRARNGKAETVSASPAHPSIPPGWSASPHARAAARSRAIWA